MRTELTKLMLVGGGTGGHVTPLVALAQAVKLKHKACLITYVGAKNDQIGVALTADQTLFNSRFLIKAGKFHRFSHHSPWALLCFWQADFWKNLSNFVLFQVGCWQSLGYLIINRPQIIFSKGGYVSVPVCLGARILRIPLVTHDSDAVLGLAHFWFRKYATKQLVGFLPADNKSSKLIGVGVPVNPTFSQPLPSGKKQQVLAKYGLSLDDKLVLVTGGGAGAKVLNEAVLEVIDSLDLPSNVHIIIASGSKNYQATKAEAQKLKFRANIQVFDFINDMVDLIRVSYGVITRAGATILTELSLAKQAIIVVPNPILPRSHQVHNAQIFKSAAWIVEDAGLDIDTQGLKVALVELLNNDQQRRQYQQAIAKLTDTQATQKTLKILESVIKS